MPDSDIEMSDRPDSDIEMSDCVTVREKPSFNVCAYLPSSVPATNKQESSQIRKLPTPRRAKVVCSGRNPVPADRSSVKISWCPDIANVGLLV